MQFGLSGDEKIRGYVTVGGQQEQVAVGGTQPYVRMGVDGGNVQNPGIVMNHLRVVGGRNIDIKTMWVGPGCPSYRTYLQYDEKPTISSLGYVQAYDKSTGIVYEYSNGRTVGQPHVGRPHVISSGGCVVM